MIMLKRFIVLFIFVSVLSGCVTSTKVEFYSDVEDVELYIDGKPYGTMPVEVTISNGIWLEPDVILEKEGYKTIYDSVNKEIKGINLFAGLLIWWPSLLWSYGPEEDQYYHMVRDGS